MQKGRRAVAEGRPAAATGAALGGMAAPARSVNSTLVNPRHAARQPLFARGAGASSDVVRSTLAAWRGRAANRAHSTSKPRPSSVCDKMTDCADCVACLLRGPPRAV